jgi:hypothetical protein
MDSNWRLMIILNNYLHDVASAFLLASAIIVYVLGRQARGGGDGEKLALARAYRTLTRVAWGALAWIIVGGIPRTIFFNRFEFIPAQTNGIVADLIIKHVLLVSAVIAGSIMWVRIGKQARTDLAGTRD